MEDTRNIVELRREKLQLDEIVESVASPSCGATSTFIGTTRDVFENKKVVTLEYEAYDAMALKEMRNICEDVRSKWSVERIAIYHRLGQVPVLEASVVIAVSSPHRRESLKSVEYIIDRLKANVPIWKKEIYENEEAQWKENKECPWSAKTEIQVMTEETEDGEDSHLDIEIDPGQVQIRADNEELSRRIEAFVTRKRQQVNTVNIQEFCSHRYLNDESENSCARVDAILVQRKDSKSHVKVHRVLNSRGPQTMDPLMLFADSSKSGHRNSIETSEHSALEERLSFAEKFLRVAKPIPKDIYERVKNIEDRILHLESVSPEYKDFWISENTGNPPSNRKPVRKRTYSTAELDSKLLELENRYVKRMK